MDFIDGKAIALIGRNKNSVVLEYDKGVLITTDILQHNLDASEPHIELDDIDQAIQVFAKNILLEAKNSNVDPQSIVFGERLVELLRWMIRVMKTHKHPPNGSPIPDFFKEADRRSNNMEDILLNKHVKSK